jgi:uncharacterized protein
MNDDDQEPSSDPFGSPESEPAERTMSYFGAIGWMLLTLLITRLVIDIANAIRRLQADDIVLGFGLQAAGILVAFFLILRFYAPELSIRHFIGLRSSHGAFYVIGAVLGVLITIPATTLYELIHRRNPTGADQGKYMIEQFERGTAWQIATFAIVVIAGPFLEEVFYRGALFRPMRRENAPLGVILVSSVVFAFAHGDKNIFFPIALVGMTMGLLRFLSGSLLPSVLMHMTFNGVSFWSVYASFHEGNKTADESLPPLWIIASTSIATLALIIAACVLGARSQTARESRAEDLV